jgi:hypothetical protein
VSKNIGNTPVINNVAPRNTSTITTNTYNIDIYDRLALFVNNTLDQAVNVTAEYSRDGINFSSVGAALTVPASAGGRAYDNTQIEAFRLLNGWLRFKATPAVAPTTGNLTIEFQALN